jgi:hypothetical protein
MGEYKIQTITDTQKFAVMTEKYDILYGGYLNFSHKIGVGKSSVNDWERRIKRRIGHKSKTQICKVFSLNFKVWTEEFYDEKTFREALQSYEQITDLTLKKRLDTKIIGAKAVLIGSEEDELNTLRNQKRIEISFEKLKNKSLLFSFKLIPLLITNSQIKDALEVIDYLQNFDSTFKLYNYNQLEHYKAIIYSHSSVRKWDKAIEILRFLYSVSNYHLQNHEIITLMASNYKRKALTLDTDFSWCKKEDMDLDLISNAIVLYNEAYNYKTNDKKYYDAINLAYLYKILDTFDNEENNNNSIKTLYKKLTLKWIYNRNSWWEVSTNAEFLMLQGNVKQAIFEIENYLEQNEVKIFCIETTLRQLEMYIHFCNDKNAQEFYIFLKESWKYIKN